ncbi:hypothetical protein [Fortiea sp. LEGE XX443]|nr:hypothetical protein [Fortiea sp. LEGE XX443]
MLDNTLILRSPSSLQTPLLQNSAIADLVTYNQNNQQYQSC